MSTKISDIRNSQQQAPLNFLFKIRSKMKGFMSANKLASLFKGKVNVEPTTPSPIFTAKEVVDHTKQCVVDPDLIQTADMASKLVQAAKDRPHAHLPGDEVGSEKWKKWINLLHERLTMEVPPSETSDGICDSRGVPNNWNTLYSIPGKPMRPQGYPLCSNKSNIPVDGFKTQRHEDILRELIRRMIGDKWEPQSGYEISRKSGSGFPLATFDIEEKISMLHTLAKEWPFFYKLFEADDLRTIAKRFKVVFCYLISRRNQNDKIDIEKGVKDRSSPSVGQAAGFEAGMLISGREADDIQGFFRTRSRVVYAGSGALNYFFSALWQPLRDNYLSKFAFTWKHTGAEQLEDKLKGWLPIGVDASQFDQNFPTFVAEVIFDELRAVFQDSIVDVMRTTWFQPAFCPSPVEGHPEQWAFFGHPFDKSTFKLERGLPSGIAYNPDFGKIWGTAYLLMMLDDRYHDVLEFGVDKILLGQHPAYALLNQGDDALILTKTQETKQQMIDMLNSGEASPYINLEVESPVTFLGWVVTYNGSIYKVLPNIISMVVNFVANEHPVGHPLDERGHRKHWGLGVESWFEVFGLCPEYDKVRKILDSVTAEVYGRTLTAIAEPYARLSKEVLQVSGLSLDEARFLEKPERRFYSVDKNKIRQPIMDDVVRTISPSEIARLCKPYVNNNYL